MGLSKEVKENRKPEHEINPLLLDRWSPRSMTGEEVLDEDLMGMFEAAKWAPSAFNSQPWVFVYAKRGTEHWDKLFNLMGEFNQNWTKNASALVVVISRKNFEYNGKPNPTHQFDTGAAWENLALEARNKGYYAHGMSGFDYDKAKVDLEVPDDCDILAMVAIGKKDSRDKLAEDMRKDESPNGRKKLEEIIMEGTFKS